MERLLYETCLRNDSIDKISARCFRKTAFSSTQPKLYYMFINFIQCTFKVGCNNVVLHHISISAIRDGKMSLSISNFIYREVNVMCKFVQLVKYCINAHLSESKLREHLPVKSRLINITPHSFKCGAN